MKGRGNLGCPEAGEIVEWLEGLTGWDKVRKGVGQHTTQTSAAPQKATQVLPHSLTQAKMGNRFHLTQVPRPSINNA